MDGLDGYTTKLLLSLGHLNFFVRSKEFLTRFLGPKAKLRYLKRLCLLEAFAMLWLELCLHFGSLDGYIWCRLLLLRLGLRLGEL